MSYVFLSLRANRCRLIMYRLLKELPVFKQLLRFRPMKTFVYLLIRQQFNLYSTSTTKKANDNITKLFRFAATKGERRVSTLIIPKYHHRLDTKLQPNIRIRGKTKMSLFLQACTYTGVYSFFTTYWKATTAFYKNGISVSNCRNQILIWSPDPLKQVRKCGHTVRILERKLCYCLLYFKFIYANV